MAGVIVFHHAQGLTSGVEEFASQLRAAGHQVETPDLYEGETFATLDDGVAYADRVGFEAITERGRAAVEDGARRGVRGFLARGASGPAADPEQAGCARCAADALLRAAGGVRDAVA